jgi:CO/xanthine dehydrogenase FAD-binding subunit
LKPPQFDYHDPTTVAEVLALLQQFGDEAKLLAGGQSLIPVLSMRLARPQVLIDLNKVEGLSYIREEDGVLAVGAMTRHATLEKSELVNRRQPLLRECMRHIGHTQIRNRGTIGGSLAHADPSAELPALMVALEGTLRITGPSGDREVAAEDLFLMYFTTCVQADELLTEVRIPFLPPRTGYAFEELARRHGDFALAGVACTLTLADNGTVADCRLGLTGVGMTPVRPRDAEDLLKGQLPSPEQFAAAAELVKGGIMPDSDIHASGEYRQHLAGVLTERALARSLSRCNGEEGEGA